jgi:hypothetical protein
MLPVSPTTDDTLTMRPLPRSTMWASAAWQRKKAPERFTASTLCQSSSVMAATVVHGDAGVVDQDVEAPVTVYDLTDRAAAVAGGADIAPVRRSRRPVRPGLRQQVGDEPFGAVIVTVVAHRDRRALIGQAVGDRGPDATGAAGDKGHAASQLVRGRRVRLAWCGFQYVGHVDNSVLGGVQMSSESATSAALAPHMP